MTLARRLTYTILVLTVGLTLVAVTPLWVMFGIRSSVRLAYDEYKELRMVDGAVLHLGSVLGLLRAPQVEPGELREELEDAHKELARFLAFQSTQSSDAPEHEDSEHVIATRTLERVRELEQQLRESVGISGVSVAESAALRAGVESTLDELKGLSDQTAAGIEGSQARVFARIRRAMVISTFLVIVTLAAVAGLSIVQYRGMIRPLRLLRNRVGQIAAGDFSQRLDVTGRDELAEVAREFDRMSERLETLYRSLEDKVRRTSRELARSERLASVGFLAAGVAHEINNPLNIISGHAELMLRRFERASAEQGQLPSTDAQAGLQIIREESFRCKAIIERLLSLARPGGGGRGPVNLARVASDVIRNLQALREHEKACVELDAPSDGGPMVLGNEAELKQVLLNLLLNAFQALPDGQGCVRVRIQPDSTRTLLIVEDEGRGMSRETLERIFEPFFTERRGYAEPGTGLGLSITHAIVESHGGTIRAESAGPGKGSRFTVELPSITPAGAAL